MREAQGFLYLTQHRGLHFREPRSQRLCATVSRRAADPQEADDARPAAPTLQITANGERDSQTYPHHAATTAVTDRAARGASQLGNASVLSKNRFLIRLHGASRRSNVTLV